MGRTRTIAGIIAGVSLAALLTSVGSMAVNFSKFNAASGRRLYVFDPVDERRFQYAGREVTITDGVDQRLGVPAGDHVVVDVKYGDSGVRLAATVPPGSAQLPGLVRHADWLKVVRFAERGSGGYDEFLEQLRTRQIPDRLVLVMRRPLPGTDPRTYGEVWRKSWVFDFYELLPDGSIGHEQLGFPSGRSHTPSRPGELVDGTWQMSAAKMVMPAHASPSPKLLGDAIMVARWQFPVAMSSVLVLVVSTAVWVAPRRRSA